MKLQDDDATPSKAMQDELQNDATEAMGRKAKVEAKAEAKTADEIEKAVAKAVEWGVNEPLTDYTGINDVGYIEVPAKVFELNDEQIAFLKTVRCDTFGKKGEPDIIENAGCTDSQIDPGLQGRRLHDEGRLRRQARRQR